MQPHHTDISLAAIPIALGVGKLMELLIKAQPLLASLSYVIAVVAGAITVYYKIKNRG